MIDLNITIGGNLELVLQKGRKQDLKDITEKASKERSSCTDAILTDLLDASGYLNNNWHEDATLGLERIPTIGFGWMGTADNGVEYYEKKFQYSDYQTKSFLTELLENKRVIFKRV